MTSDQVQDSQERTDLIEILAKHRGFLRQTLRDLTDDQARERTTKSELCLGGLVKHVTRVEDRWVNFILEGPSAMAPTDETSYAAHAASFQMLPDETLESLLSGYDHAAQRTDKVIRELPSLDAAQPLPDAPWFQAGASWSARRVLMHVLAETSQHAGHADIIRESLDGAKTMG